MKHKSLYEYIKYILGGNTVGYRKEYAIFGGASVAVYLSHAVYWQGKGWDKDWTYKTQEEWEQETGLSRHEQNNAREKLRAMGILIEQRKGVPPKIYYHVDEDRLIYLLTEGHADVLKIHRDNNWKINTGLFDYLNTGESIILKPENQLSDNRINITETTTKITTQKTQDAPKGAEAEPPPHKSKPTVPPEKPKSDKPTPYQVIELIDTFRSEKLAKTGKEFKQAKNLLKHSGAGLKSIKRKAQLYQKSKHWSKWPITPAILMSAWNYLQDEPEPAESEWAKKFEEKRR